ncbi:putative transmembrane protein [Apostichopus japonicus]|uniref:Putative transmembrane protein n=1 Tax=Stichopus japonicus TaxID=307972 RepID=A0A2G8KWY1_STIJA|nr:putative transmembrane protein [Apostichopus japonicus]
MTLDRYDDEDLSNQQGMDSFTVGLIAAGVAILGFGCNLVPVKRVSTGDGMFYQWIECACIWLVGLTIQLLRSSPPVYPLAMIGGVFWTTGNICVVPCMKTIGMGLGILLWGSTNLLTGWACGHFGLFGLAKDEIEKPLLNYFGLGFALLRLLLFLFVKADAGISGSGPSPQPVTFERTRLEDEDDPLLVPPHLQSGRMAADLSVVDINDSSWVDALSPLQRRLTGCTLALFSGSLYGFTFVPCLYIQQNYKDASDSGLDYVFSMFSGVFASSTVYFLIYSAYMQNRPQLPPNIFWPSAICGIIWAIAQIGWFVATYNLSLSVSFPIVTSGPAVIAAAWSVFYFHEIRGFKNYMVLSIGVVTVVAASVLSALSRV